MSPGPCLSRIPSREIGVNAQGADDSFREFVVGFSDPLARLAFLLMAGTSAAGPTESVNADAAAAHAAVIGALARLQRQWHDVGTTGSPETVVVEELVGALPRARKRVEPALAEPPAVEEAPAAAVDVDVDDLRAGLWQAWTVLAPRQRVPLLFADASVASRRLAGLDVPASLGRARTREALAAEAMRELKTSLLADVSTRSAATRLGEVPLKDVLLDVLREHGSTAAAPIDPYPMVISRAREVRLRSALVASVVVLVLAATTAVAVKASQPAKTAAVRSGPSASTTLRPQATPPAQPTRPTAQSVALTDRVVDWPARGTAAHDPVLLAYLLNSFDTAHPDATGVAQVLLVTDTSAFRVAYVTARSATGIIQSWFYGARGSADLVEGAWSYGGTLVADATVLASAVVDPAGRTELVVIAPPASTDIQLSDFDFSRPSSPDPLPRPAFRSLPRQNGVATEPIDSASPSLIVRVTVGANVLLTQNLATVNLAPASRAASSRPDPALASLSVVRGAADPELLDLLERAATAWHNSDAPGTPMRFSVLWGGTDDTGTRLVVGRLKMQAFDALLFEWSNAPPDEAGQYLIDSTLPDAPIAFAYQGADGTRIGVLVPPVSSTSTTASITSAVVMPGEPAWGVEFDSTGFASVALPGADNLTTISLNVDLLDKSGHLVEVIPVPPPA
jgi:hypothetical protein